jgi:hypothetical protein
MVVWLVKRGPTVSCEAAQALRDARVYDVAPSKIVVRPWFGPHHVYGIFAVPNQFMDRRYVATLAVHNFQSRLIRNLRPDKAYVDPSLAQPGHYLERAYVPTRVAVRLLLTGRFGDLRERCQWQLVFYERPIHQ